MAGPLRGGGVKGSYIKEQIRLDFFYFVAI